MVPDHVLPGKESRNNRSQGDNESRDVEVNDGIVVCLDDARPDVLGLRARFRDRIVNGLDLGGGEEAAELLRQVFGHLVAPYCGSNGTPDSSAKVGYHPYERNGRSQVLCRVVNRVRWDT